MSLTQLQNYFSNEQTITNGTGGRSFASSTNYIAGRSTYTDFGAGNDIRVLFGITAAVTQSGGTAFTTRAAGGYIRLFLLSSNTDPGTGNIGFSTEQAENLQQLGILPCFPTTTTHGEWEDAKIDPRRIKGRYLQVAYELPKHISTKITCYLGVPVDNINLIPSGSKI